MKTKGFSIVEVVMVLAILAVVFAFSAVYYQTSQVRADINSRAELLVNEMRLLISNVESGNTDGHNAIKLEESAYTTFLGPDFDSEDPRNKRTEFSPTMRLENINLNEGGTEIKFIPPHGYTENFGSFDLRSDQIDRTITINVTEIGSINY